MSDEEKRQGGSRRLFFETWIFCSFLVCLGGKKKIRKQQLSNFNATPRPEKNDVKHLIIVFNPYPSIKYPYIFELKATSLFTARKFEQTLFEEKFRTLEV